MEDNKLNETVETVNEEEKLEIENEENKEESVIEEAPYDGPSVTIGVRYDYKTLKYYNVFSMVYKRHYPILYLALAILCIAYDVYAILTQVVPVFGTENFSASLFLMPGIFLLFVIYSIFLFFNFEKSIDKNLALHFNSSNEGVTTIQATVTMEGITILSSRKEEPIKYEWSFISQIYEIPQYFYLFVGKTPIILTKDPNAVIEGSYETLEEIINEQVKTKPYKRIDKEIIKTPITYVHREDLENIEEAETFESESEEKSENQENKESQESGENN